VPVPKCLPATVDMAASFHTGIGEVTADFVQLAGQYISILSYQLSHESRSQHDVPVLPTRPYVSERSFQTSSHCFKLPPIFLFFLFFLFILCTECLKRMRTGEVVSV
jgi:hypothetical protein